MILITNGRIFTMAGKEYSSGCVLIDGSKIIEVAEYIKKPSNECRVIDAKGYWVMPGLIEAHCHLGITEEKKGYEGDDCNEDVQPITPYLRAYDAVNPMDSAFHTAISAGITTVMTGPGSSNVVGGQFVCIKTHGRSIDVSVLLEPAAMKVALGENPKTTFDGRNMMPSTRMGIAALLREELFDAREYYNKKKLAVKADEYFEPDFEMECWIPVLDKKIPLKAHVHRADDIMTAIRIAKEFDLNLTLDHCSEGHLITDEIKASGHSAIIGPSLASRNKIEVQFMDFKTAGILSRAGIKVAITTDHPVTRINCLAICAGLAAKEGLGIEEGLKAITINAAEILNISDRVGSLERGKDADIAIYDGNPMVTFTNTIYTIIEGNIVYDNGVFYTTY